MSGWSRWVVTALWLGWLAYWLVSAHRVKAVRRRESLASRLAHVLPLTLAAGLLAAPIIPGSWLQARFVPDLPPWRILGVALLVAAMTLSIWARRTLGDNWSASVTLKQDHGLVLDGPYRWVRHPIYSALLLAIAATALVLGQWRGVMAFGVAAVALWRKLRLEERWLTEHFGAAYDQYRARVKALIPGLF